MRPSDRIVGEKSRPVREIAEDRVGFRQAGSVRKLEDRELSEGEPSLFVNPGQLARILFKRDMRVAALQQGQQKPHLVAVA